MARKIQAVIGASFGDESKGSTVDYLCSKADNPLVIRFNGGCQAGHTVVTDYGNVRHIFSHFGSGSLRRIPTYLTKDFIVNPMFFLREREVLMKEFKLDPLVIVNENCPVTTPYEIMLNQAAETKRSGNRHGSCGLGIGETVERDYYYRLTVMDLFDEEQLRKKLNYIRTTWVAVRMGDLGVDFNDMPNLFLDNVFESFVLDCKKFISTVRVCTGWTSFKKEFGDIIFEGAQGLRLDQHSDEFPHVTRSHTGSDNIIKFLKETRMDDEQLDLYYITRTYLTRHGNGPLENVCGKNPYGDFEDLTNKTNPHQGVFRYALLDPMRLAYDIRRDAAKVYKQGIKLSVNLVVSHVDECRGTMKWITGGHVATGSVHSFIDEVATSVDISSYITSQGPRAADKTITSMKTSLNQQLLKGSNHGESTTSRDSV